jgi:hypothetical protein
MTATASDRSAKAKRAGLVERMRLEASELYDACEAIRLELDLDDNDMPTIYADQRLIMQNALAPLVGERWLEKTLGRWRSVNAAMRQAGRTSDYDAAKALLTKVEAEEAAEIPGLLEAIQRAEARITELQAATAAAQEDVARRDQARAVLQRRDLLPPWVVRELDDRRTCAKRDVGEVDHLRSIVQWCEVGLNIDPDNTSLARAYYLGGYLEGLPEIGVGPIKSNQWACFREKAEALLQTSRKELEPMEAELAVELEGVEQELTLFYINQL